VIYCPGNCINPVWFDLRWCKHVVRQITNICATARAKRSASIFMSPTRVPCIELVYDLGNTTWMLEKIEGL
jgi:hypothetical protein